MGRSTEPPTQSPPATAVRAGRKAAEHIKENSSSSQKINKFIKKQRTMSSTAAGKLNAMQMDPPGNRRRMGRSLKDAMPDSESSSSPIDADSSNDGSNGGGAECRRSSRKKTIKFDVRDLLNKNRKSHKIQIEARIDSNAPKVGAGQTKEELDSKQKNFIEKSAIFRRFSISENKLPPRPPPPPVALIQTIQQCVGELEQLPLDGDIDLATITPIARRLSRTQEILTASMMKPKQVNSLIVTKLESTSSTSKTTTTVDKCKVGRPKLPELVQPPVASTSMQQKRRGRPPKLKTIAEFSSDSTIESSSNDSYETSEYTEISETNTQAALASNNSSNRSSTSVVEPEEAYRQVSVSPVSSTNGIDLKETLDASAVTLIQPMILDDCMLVSTDDMFVTAEEEVFAETFNSDDSSTLTFRGSRKEKSVDEISLFARSDSTETNSSDDSERRRKKVRVSVKRVVLPSPMKDRTELTPKSRSSEKQVEVIEIYSSNDDDSQEQVPFVGTKEVVTNSKEDGNSKSISTTRASRKKQLEQYPMTSINMMEEDNSNSTTMGSVVEISSESATPVDELLDVKEKSKSPHQRVVPTRRAKSSNRVAERGVPTFDPPQVQLSNSAITKDYPQPSQAPKESRKDAHTVAVHPEQMQTIAQISLRSRRNVPEQASPAANAAGPSKNKKEIKVQTDTQRPIENQQESPKAAPEEKEAKVSPEQPVPVQQSKTDAQVISTREMLSVSHPQNPEATKKPPKSHETTIPHDQNQKSVQLSLRSRKDLEHSQSSLTSAAATSRNHRKDKQQETVPLQLSPTTKTRKQVQEAETPAKQRQTSAQILLRSRREAQEKCSLTSSLESSNIVPREPVSSQLNLEVTSKDGEEATVLIGENRAEESIFSQQRHVTLRSRKEAQDGVQPSPMSNTRKNAQEQDILGLQGPIISRSRTSVLRKHETSMTKKENEESSESPSADTGKKAFLEAYCNDLPLQEGKSLCVQSESAAPQVDEKQSVFVEEKTNEKPATRKEAKTSVQPEISKFDEKLSTTSTDRTSTDTASSSGRRESLRTAIRASVSMLKKMSPKKTSKTPAKSSVALDQTSTSSDSSEGQDNTQKNRRQPKTNIIDKSKEETSSVCSECSSITSSSSSSFFSSSSSSATSSSSLSSPSSQSSSSSSSSMSSSTHSRATRSRKAQQLVHEKPLETKVETSLKSHRITPPRKAKSDSQSAEIKSTINTDAKKWQKSEEQFTEPDSESSENAEVKSASGIIGKSSRKPEEKFTEPDSESSENSAKQRSPTSKTEKDSDILFKERAKVIQRRKSARLNRWASTIEDETNETGSESSEICPPIRRTRSGRSKGRAELTDKSELSEGLSTAGKKPSIEETPCKIAKITSAEETSTEDLVAEAALNKVKVETEKTLKAETDSSIKQKETVSKTDQSSAVELTSTSAQISSQTKKSNEKVTTESEKEMILKDVASPRSKSKKRIRKLVPIKDSSSESNTLSDDESGSSGASSRTRFLRNTRARRKTISSAIELEDIFTASLSPPDKALEYLLPKLHRSSNHSKEVESSNEEAKNTSQQKKQMDSKQEASNSFSLEIDYSTGIPEGLQEKESTKNSEERKEAPHVNLETKMNTDPPLEEKTVELEKCPQQWEGETTSALKLELLKTSKLKKGTRFSAISSDNLNNDEITKVAEQKKNISSETNLDVDNKQPAKLMEPNENTISTKETLAPDEPIKTSKQKKKASNASKKSLEPVKAASSPDSKSTANSKEEGVSKAAGKLKASEEPISSSICFEETTVELRTKSHAIIKKDAEKCIESESSSISTANSKTVAESDVKQLANAINQVNPEDDASKVIKTSSMSISIQEDVQKSLEPRSSSISAASLETIAEKGVKKFVELPPGTKTDSAVEKGVKNCIQPISMVNIEVAHEKDLKKSTSSISTEKSQTLTEKGLEKHMGSLSTVETLPVSTSSASKGVNALDEKHELHTKVSEQVSQALCLEKSQQKKQQQSPRKKKEKKSAPPHIEESQKHSEDARKFKNIKSIDALSNKAFDLKPTSSESNNSDDSLKVDAPKTDQKPTPRRQLDTSFIESLEKAILRPIAAKKALRKKDKEPITTPCPKGKEEARKSKKVQETREEQKKPDLCSPKPKKKQKDAPKIDKKPDEDTSNKRKILTKVKEPESVKPLEPDPSKIEIRSTVEDFTDSTAMVTVNAEASAAVKQQVIEVTPVNPSKSLKSKAETKFYADATSNQEDPSTVVKPRIDLVVEKEKSPDLLPDPLKDIEKFIEDGVNLLKRGYKLDDDDDTTLDRDILKSDDLLLTPKKCKLDDSPEEKKESPPEDDNSNSNSESSTLATTPTSDTDTPNGIRRSHRIKNNSKSTKCLVGRGLVREKERFSTKDDEKTIYSIDDQKMDLAEVEAKNSKFLKDMEERLSNFRVIRENEYKCERVISKEARRMLCDCFLTSEEEERGELGCGEDCLNRLLMIECGSDCTVRDRCTNRRFTKFLYSPCRVFRTEKKGFGIMADIEILPGEFIMEYVGEVINGDEFEFRRNAYSQDKNKHYYFMALRSDAIIDATAKGNISRFINHSCDPNAETQKWTVNGELRIGFFSRKSIMPGEEITFDYQYQRYGKEAQKCYCESSNCRGWIGEEPSSEEEEELDGDEEGESEESEEEEIEEQPLVPMPAIPTITPSIPVDQQFVPVIPIVSEVPAVDKIIEVPPGVEVIAPMSVRAPIVVETPIASPKDLQPKKKKEKKRLLERKEEKIKRRETKQFLEDPDIEDEVRFLVKCGLKNQADTLRLSRLIVRAKLLGTRIKLLQILRKGELPCRRLFLDYHGLRLLHGWMSEVIDTRDTEKSMEIRMALLSVLECLPISNKTMLTDSKVYQTVRDWSNNKESHSPSDESPKDTNAPSSSPTGSEDSSSELQKLAAKLVTIWDNLPEVFRIPKRERIEQMKEHEREADRQYKGLGDDVSRSEGNRNRERFMRSSGPKGSRFKWSRGDKDKERDRTGDRRKFPQNGGSSKDGNEKATGMLVGDSQLSKEQRRELFAAKVARDEAEKRLAEERREFDIKCRFFGLDPKRMRPENMPFCVNPSTGQWYSTDKKPISTPPSYAHVQVPVKPKSTNPNDYRLPPMDLPPLWKFAISPKGKIYYYHVKIRIPQWEPPIKILPLAGQSNAPLKNSESDSSNADLIDSSEDDIDVIKGLDPVKLQAYIEKKIEDRRLQRYNRLVEEKPISPRKEEDRIYNQMEVRKYKENKEKIRKRKEEIRRKRDCLVKGTPIDSSESAKSDESAVDAVPIQDYLLSSDEEDIIKAECNNSPLIDKIVQGDKIVDELDALKSKRPLKRPLPIREKNEHKKRKVDKSGHSSKSTKRSKDGENSGSSKYRKIREKFRCEIAGIIVQHLKPYRKETCFSGRILTDDDFNHLARKLTHFVMVKELKYCESIGQTLVVTESVKNKSREFIKKYMAKYGGVYVRPKNDPEFKEIPFL